MKELILHIGLHKTASSSIQETLANNVSLLNQNGLNFPIFRGPENQSLCNHSVPIQNIFRSDPQSYNMNIVNNWHTNDTHEFYKRQLISFMQKPNTLLLSGEDISSLTLQEFKALKRFFDGYRIRVIAFIRDSYSYHCSATQQRVKGGFECFDDPKVEKKSKRISDLKKVFPDTEFYSFKEACHFKGGPVRFFLELINCNIKNIDLVKTNEGVSFHSVRLLNYINVNEPAIIDGLPNPSRADFIPQDIRFDDSKFLLTKQELGKIIDAIKLEDIALEKETNLQLSPGHYETKEIFVPKASDIIQLMRYSLSQPKPIRKFINEYLLSNQFVSKNKVYLLLCLALVRECPLLMIRYGKGLMTKILSKF